MMDSVNVVVISCMILDLCVPCDVEVDECVEVLFHSFVFLAYSYVFPLLPFHTPILAPVGGSSDHRSVSIIAGRRLREA